MEIEILEMAERRARFILRNSSPAMANALRRTLLSDIPKMAIDKVEFHLGPIMDGEKEYESMTPLFDEIIAHRLGMVPVPTDLDLFVPQDQCTCGGEGCPNCSIMYSLNKHGPCTVLSGDLMPLGNPDLKVNLPVIDIDSGRASDEAVLEAASVCPKRVYAVEDGKLVAKDPLACNLCMSCVERVGSDRGLSVRGDETNFIFKFETDGSLTARQALDKAVEILSREADEFAEGIEALAQ